MRDFSKSIDHSYVCDKVMLHLSYELKHFVTIKPGFSQTVTNISCDRIRWKSQNNKIILILNEFKRVSIFHNRLRKNCMISFNSTVTKCQMTRTIKIWKALMPNTKTNSTNSVSRIFSKSHKLCDITIWSHDLNLNQIRNDGHDGSFLSRWNVISNHFLYHFMKHGDI